MNERGESAAGMAETGWARVGLPGDAEQRADRKLFAGPLIANRVVVSNQGTCRRAALRLRKQRRGAKRDVQIFKIARLRHPGIVLFMDPGHVPGEVVTVADIDDFVVGGVPGPVGDEDRENAGQNGRPPQAK